MCLEKKIEELTAAINRLNANMSGTAEPAPQQPAPQQPAPQQPAPQQPAPQQPASNAGAAPFTDGASLVAYTMQKFQQLGPEKGALINNVLGELGVSNINDIPAEKYNEYFTKVEAIQ